MATAIGTIGHEERLSLVGHLDELRTRLIVSLAVVAAAFAAACSVLRDVETQLRREQAHLAAITPGEKPVTLGIGEPLTATVTVTLIFALILAAPIVLYELYGFVLPAFSPRQRSIARPLILAVALLFVIGVLFGYFVVLPSAIHFLEIGVLLASGAERRERRRTSG